MVTELRAHGFDLGEDPARAMWTVCASVPTLFHRPLQPPATVLDRCEFTHEDGFIAPAGFDFPG